MAYTYGTPEWDNAYAELVKERLATRQKPYWLGTPEWIATYEKLVQEDAPYKEAAKNWEGSVVIHILANPAAGIDKDYYLFLDLWHGDCRFIRPVPEEVGKSADFVITGELERWQAVMKKELDTIKGMMQGKLKLKGDLPTIVRAVKAASRLVELSTMIDTIFPTEMNPQELEEFRSWLNGFWEEFGI